MARLILIRHGESIANAERRFTHGPEEPLTAAGREEVARVARLLVERFDPVALYASPYVRALETARIIGRAFALEPTVVPDLREQHYGELHGHPYEAARGHRALRELGIWEARPPGGESLADVAQRAGPVLEELAKRHLGQQILVVSHGGVMAAVRAWTTGRYEGPPVVSANATGYVLLRQRGAWHGPFGLEDEIPGL